MRFLALILLLPFIGKCQDTLIDNGLDPYFFKYTKTDWSERAFFSPLEPIYITIDSSFYLPSDSIPFIQDTHFYEYERIDTSQFWYLKHDVSEHTSKVENGWVVTDYRYNDEYDYYLSITYYDRYFNEIIFTPRQNIFMLYEP